MLYRGPKSLCAAPLRQPSPSSHGAGGGTQAREVPSLHCCLSQGLAAQVTLRSAVWQVGAHPGPAPNSLGTICLVQIPWPNLTLQSHLSSHQGHSGCHTSMTSLSATTNGVPRTSPHPQHKGESQAASKSAAPGKDPNGGPARSPACMQTPRAGRSACQVVRHSEACALERRCLLPPAFLLGPAVARVHLKNRF